MIPVLSLILGCTRPAVVDEAGIQRRVEIYRTCEERAKRAVDLPEHLKQQYIDNCVTELLALEKK